MDESLAVKFLGALAQEHRLRIYRRLVVAGLQGETPGLLGEALALPAATLSFHLKELVHAGLVTQERSGRNLIYRADLSCMNRLIQFLTENCCGGLPCGC